jgi:uncharacterized protein (TIGR02300 family)
LAKPEWGTKRICHSCGTRFYDLLRDPIVCPSCGSEFDPEALLRTRRSRSVVSEREPAVVEAAAPEPEAPEVEVEVEAEVEVAAAAVEESEEAADGEDAAVGEDADEAKEGKKKEEEDLIEDPSELGEDEDDMAEVIDQVDPEDDR